MKSLAEHLLDYREHIQRLKYARDTVRTNTNAAMAMLRYLASVHAVEMPSQLSVHVLEAYQRHYSSHRNASGELIGAITVNSTLSKIRSFLIYLAEVNVIHRKLTKAFTKVREPKRLPRGVFEYHKIREVLERIDTTDPLGIRDRAILELLYSSGIRSAELLKLDMKDINFQKQLMLIQGKGNKERLLPLGDTAAYWIRQYQDSVRPFMGARSDEVAVFLSRRGRRLCYDALRETVHRHCHEEEFGCSITPHAFRRSFATELIRSEANLYHVKELMGHERLDTLKHYARLNIDDLRKTHKQCHPREKK